MLQSDACYVGAARRYSDHWQPLRGRSATFPVTWNRLRKRSIVFRVQTKCPDTTVADMPAFSIPTAWFHSSLFSLGIFLDLFQHNFIELWRFLEKKKNVKSYTDTGYDYVPHKANVQNELLESFAGTHSLLRVKFGQHINQRLCVHLIFS